MSSALYRLGRFAFRRRTTVIGAWLAVLAVLGAAAGLFMTQLDNGVSIPGTESQQALDRLAATFPEASGTTAQVLVVAPDGQDVATDDVVAAVADAAGAFRDVPGVRAVADPFDTQTPGGVRSATTGRRPS
ncbi:MMPL family transporter [Cellulomonas sp. JZ18]|uniref:MMPL family transporter n=1 Tax=Cellulomonas sp. JZ18 TaxID=2654191 RepID=UPI001E5C8341|nr:MMPL family transporter [Cellulomonas sp. JZ18]